MDPHVRRNKAKEEGNQKEPMFYDARLDEFKDTNSESGEEACENLKTRALCQPVLVLKLKNYSTHNSFTYYRKSQNDIINRGEPLIFAHIRQKT